MYVQLELTICQMYCNCMSVYLAITHGGHMPGYSGWTIVPRDVSTYSILQLVPPVGLLVAWS